MIGRMVTYTYGTIRARALATRLLSSSELTGLADQDSFDQAVADVEHRLNLSAANRTIDHRLVNDYLSFARILLNTLPENLQDLFRTYLERPWLENLLLLCRLISAGPRSIGPFEFQPVLPYYLALPDVEKIDGLGHLGTFLPEGAYREILLGYPERQNDRASADLENRLIHAYWERLDREISRLSPLDRETAGEILGKRADLDGCRVVRRGLEAELEPDRILDCWPRLAGLLDLRRLRRTLNSTEPRKGLDDLLQRAVGTYAREESFEIALRRRLRRSLRHRLLGGPFDTGMPLGALLLKELEVADLQGLLGGMRFLLDRENLEANISAGKD